MISHFLDIFISVNILLLTKCLIGHTQVIKTNKVICIEDQSRTVAANNLQVCYVNDIQNRSILVWFTIGTSLNNTFDSYRFILRSMNNSLLTNFTKLIDFNNSLRMFHLNSGQYEVCIEFQSNLTTFIYQPRDGCILIHIGESLHGSFKQSSTPLLIALATGIILFFILGLLVQWAKEKRRKKDLENDKPRSRSSSILTAIVLRKQRDSLVRNLFHHHIDQPRVSHMRQWARCRAFRHRVSTQEQEIDRPRSFRRWNKNLFASSEQSSQPRSRMGTISDDRKLSSTSDLTTNQIYTISGKEHYQMPPRKPSFHLAPPEEY